MDSSSSQQQDHSFTDLAHRLSIPTQATLSLPTVTISNEDSELESAIENFKTSFRRLSPKQTISFLSFVEGVLSSHSHLLLSAQASPTIPRSPPSITPQYFPSFLHPIPTQQSTIPNTQPTIQLCPLSNLLSITTDDVDSNSLSSSTITSTSTNSNFSFSSHSTSTNSNFSFSSPSQLTQH